MKTVRVAAAVIFAQREGAPAVFATARGYGDWKGRWEFPGGKLEPGETAEQALRREILEELDTEIRVEEKLGTVEYDYPQFHLSMDCFSAEVLHGDLCLKEAAAARWLNKDNLYTVNWLPADLQLLPAVEERLNRGGTENGL